MRVSSLALAAAATLVSFAEAGTQHLARAGALSSKHHSRAQVHNNQPRTLVKRFGPGKGSFYDPETGNQGACGGFIGRNDWVVALNTDQFAGGSHCNQQVTITANGHTEVATIKDACPGCGYAGLDMTPGLFSAFADQSVGIIQVTWTFGSGGGSGGGDSNNNNGGGNNNNNNDNHDAVQHTTSTTHRTTPQWTPTTTSTPWTPSSTSTRRRTTSSSTRNTWTPSSSSSPRSTWTPPTTSSTWSSSSSSRWSSSWTPSSSAVMNSTTAVNSTSAESSSTVSSSSDSAIAATGTNIALVSPNSSNTTQSEVSGALGNVAQVVLRMANVVVQAADSA